MGPCFSWDSEATSEIASREKVRHAGDNLALAYVFRSGYYPLEVELSTGKFYVPMCTAKFVSTGCWVHLSLLEASSSRLLLYRHSAASFFGAPKVISTPT